MRYRRSRGIVLVSVMFIAILVGMYMAAASVLNQGRFSSLRQSTENRLAEEASRSGLEYALARLEENPRWRGDLNTITVDSPGLTVVEDNGNVVGLLTSPAGGVAQFRLRFNHQDGAAGGDDLDDPAGAMMFDSPHISVNNLLGMMEAELPHGDGPDFSAQTVADYPVPAGVVALVCEGRVAGDFTNANATNANPLVARPDAVRVIESFYRIDSVTSDNLPDAVSMAGKQFDAKLYQLNASNPPRLSLQDIRENGSPRIRARDGDITVTDQDTNSPGEVIGVNGELLVASGRTVAADLAAGVTIGEEDTSDDFYQLAWDQVQQPDSSAGALLAGVYEVRDDGRVYRYNMNFEDYKTYKATNPNDEGGQGTATTLDGSNGVLFVAKGEAFEGETSDRHRFVFTKDVLVETAGDVVDLTITPAKGAKEDLEDEAAGGAGTYRTDIDWSQSYFSGGPSTIQDVPAKLNYLSSQVEEMENADTNVGSPLHKFLLELADEGIIDNGEGDSYTWSLTNFGKNGDGHEAFDDYLAGLISPTGLVNRNDDALPPGGVLDVNKTYNYFKMGGGGIATNFFGENPATTDPTTVNDMEVNFAPNNQNGARLANRENEGGDIRIAADVKGKGASIKSDGEIRLVGMGFDIDSGNLEDGPSISLYAKDDIIISTLKPDGSGDYQYSGMELRGLLYSWANIELKAGHEDAGSGDSQRVFLQGAMVAYGGIPGDEPGSGNGGSILLTGDQLDLVFDPTYLLGLRSESDITVSLDMLSRSFR